MDDTPYINDGADASLRKTVSLLNKIEAKTGATTITGPVTVSSEVEVKNDSGNPIPIKEGFSIPEYDSINLSYDGSGNVSGVTYLKNNASVASLSLQYDGSGNLTSVNKT